MLAWGAPYMLWLLVEPVRFIWCEIAVLLQHTRYRHWHGHPTRSRHRVGGWCCWIWGIASILMRVCPCGRTVRSRWLLRLCSFGVNRWLLSKHTAKDLKQCCKIRFRLQKKITIYPYPLLSTTELNPFAPRNFASKCVWFSSHLSHYKELKLTAKPFAGHRLCSLLKLAKFRHAQKAKFQAVLGWMG